MACKLELYIHIPFCVQKCAYCDFLSGPADDSVKRNYVDALLMEIQSCGDFSDYTVTSIFFGGGTPSILPGEWVEELMTAIRNKFCLEEHAETTIEANPGTVDPDKLKKYRQAGINRISFGCQSADNQELKMLGRIHTWEEFLESYHMAREAGFQNINVDLMSGLPGQTAVSWEETLRKAAELSPEHISAYSLIIEEGTPFFKNQNSLNLPEEEEERRMYEQTAEILKEYGYGQYEISNYAKPGCACRHNIGYWTGVEYLGLGAGSASLIEHCRFTNEEDLELYMKNSASPELLRQNEEPLSVENEMEEFMILGLRMTEGISEEEFQERFHIELEEVYGEQLEKYCREKFLEKRDGRIRFTREGISVSNVILAEFLF